MIKADKMPDNHYVLLDFENDKIGFVDTGYCQKATRNMPLEIYGTDGTISFNPPGTTWPNPKVYIDSLERGIRGWIEPASWVERRPAVFNHCSCLTDLIDAIEKDKQPVLSPEHARHVIEIMCAIPKSIETGGFVELKTTFEDVK